MMGEEDDEAETDLKRLKRSRDLAREQFHQDAKTANDLSRAAAQVAILINGGAATAILAYASNIGKGDGGTTAKTLILLPIALGIYAVGALLGASMMFCLSRSIDHYMGYWLDRADPPSDRGKRPEKPAEKWFIAALVCFGLSAGLFAVASLAVAVGWATGYLVK